MTQFLRDQASDSEEVVTPLMLDGTYLSLRLMTANKFSSGKTKEMTEKLQNQKVSSKIHFIIYIFIRRVYFYFIFGFGRMRSTS